MTLASDPQVGREIGLGIRRFGQFEADFRTGELRRDGVRIKLQEQPLQILVLLLQKPGAIVRREELRARLWPADTFVDFDHSLNTAVKRLRDALGDSADDPRFVETLPRRGYRFIAPVTSSEEPVEQNGSGLPEFRRFRHLLLAAFIGMLVLAALFTGWELGRRKTMAAPSRFAGKPIISIPTEVLVKLAGVLGNGRSIAY